MKKIGTLLHVSSLPGPFGIGTFGKKAYEFIDFLVETQQTYWQILPLGPTSYKDSPYQSTSSFAGNPYFIDFDLLYSEGLLKEEDYQSIHLFHDESIVDYEKQFLNKWTILEKTYRYRQKVQKEFDAFIEKNHSWLYDYALFASIKMMHHHQSWNHWPILLRTRDEQALRTFEYENEELIKKQQFIQFLFFKQWESLKNYANKHQIQIIGDMPIYVAYDSADVWQNPHLFLLDNTFNPTCIAGCPPDAFAKKGQLWGNPIYDWQRMKLDHFSWWIKRIEHASALFDVTRIDHFRGFSRYYSIDGQAKDATTGVWVSGPQEALFDAIKKQLPGAKIIAENLGFLDEDVARLLNHTQFPGMLVLQFEMFKPHYLNDLRYHIDKNTVLYTGTHDNPPIVSWYKQLPNKMKTKLQRDLQITSEEDIHWSIIKLAFQSNANTIIIPLQDYLGLNEDARMNTPSTTKGNWTYRIKSSDITENLKDKIIDVMKTAL